jgi:hypothetical protein
MRVGQRRWSSGWRWQTSSAARLAVVRRKGELNKKRIDREWPHQIALPIEAAGGRNTIIIQRFCRDLSIVRGIRAIAWIIRSSSSTALPREPIPSSSRRIRRRMGEPR